MHIKRYSMPKLWPVQKKGKVFVVRPLPGPHSLKRCIPLQIVIQKMLGLAETREEARKVLGTKKVMVNKKVRTGLRFPVGFMDIVEITDPKHHYRMDITPAGFSLEKISPADSESKLYKVTGKKVLKGGSFQLNLHDGSNILIGKKAGFHVGDSILVDFKEGKILKHTKFAKGASAKIIDGRNMGEFGKIKEIRKRKSMLEKSTVTITTGKGRDVETLDRYVFVGE